MESRSKVSELFLQLRSNHDKFSDTKRHFLALCIMYDFQISESSFTIIGDSHEKKAQPVANRECVTFTGVGGMKLPEWRKYRQTILQTLELQNCLCSELIRKLLMLDSSDLLNLQKELEKSK